MSRLKPAVVIIDMQNAFFSAGPLQQLHERLVSRCNALHAWATARDIPVFRVRTEHRRDRSTWTLNMLEDDMGFLLAGDSDAASLSGLETEATIEVVKTRDSAFHQTALAGLLADRDVGVLVLAGVSSHTCVAATAADAYAHNLHVIFAEDAIASHRKELHEPALATLCDEYRLERRSVDDIVASLDPTRDMSRTASGT